MENAQTKKCVRGKSFTWNLLKKTIDGKLEAINYVSNIKKWSYDYKRIYYRCNVVRVSEDSGFWYSPSPSLNFQRLGESEPKKHMLNLSVNKKKLFKFNDILRVQVYSTIYLIAGILFSYKHLKELKWFFSYFLMFVQLYVLLEKPFLKLKYAPSLFNLFFLIVYYSK